VQQARGGGDRGETGATAQRVARGRVGRTPTPMAATPAATTAAAPRAAEPDDAVPPRGSDAVAVVPALPPQPVPTVGHACGSEGRSSRYIPASVKREVWRRDAGRCAFRGTGGRCRETGRLEVHHRLPVADGGAATVQNLELRCTAHHAHESRRWFGEAVGWFDGASASVNGEPRLPPELGPGRVEGRGTTARVVSRRADG
jgi:hypothetical protein